MDAEVGVDAGEDQARDERRRQELQDVDVDPSRITSPRLFDRVDEQVDVVVEELM